MPKYNKKDTTNCSAKEIVSKAIDIYKKSNAKNPIKTGNKAADILIGKLPLAKDWNKGFNIGKTGFIIKQTFDEVCKPKKK